MPLGADRAALRARQGVGARYDAAEAPVDNLLLVRHGTAYFLRLLNRLPDDALVDKARKSGRSRAWIIAHVSYHARGLAQQLEGARSGLEVPEHTSPAARDAEVALGESLPPRALHGLFRHAAIHLDVTWRDMPGPLWDAVLRRLDGSVISARDTPLMRARLIWQAALDLDAGGRATDVPPQLVSTLNTPRCWPWPDVEVARTSPQDKSPHR